MEVEHIEQISTIGTYQAQLVPDRHSTALISNHDIITRGHIITFTDHRCIIEDAAGQYALRLPRIPASREWRAPLYTLQLLSDLAFQTPATIFHALPTTAVQSTPRNPQCPTTPSTAQHHSPRHAPPQENGPPARRHHGPTSHLHMAQHPSHQTTSAASSTGNPA